MKENPKIVFMGTPEIGKDILSRLIKGNLNITAVITRPDKPKGRGKVLGESPVKIFARDSKIPIYQPKSKDELTDILEKLSPDLGIVAAFGMIIPEKALSVPRHGMINFHPSLLPLYRGPAPISMPIMCGEKETGVSIITVTPGMDEGDILSQESIKLSGTETTPELEKILAALGAKMLIKLVPEYLKGGVTTISQDHSKATYTHLVKKEDAEIIWDKYWAIGIEQAARAFIPWPGIYTFWNGKKIDIYEPIVVKTDLKPGEVGLKDGAVIIGTAKDGISPKYLKLEGKKKIPANEFVRGYPNFIGSNLAKH